MTIEPGQLCIINFADQPCARLIVEIIRISGDVVHGVYLDKRLEGRQVSGLKKDVRLLSDFGIQLKNSRAFGLFYIGHLRLSKVKYENGEIRPWQPEHNEYFRLSDQMTPWKTDYAVRYFMNTLSHLRSCDIENYVLPLIKDINNCEFNTMGEVQAKVNKIQSWSKYDLGISI